jgi:hypothetical protein
MVPAMKKSTAKTKVKSAAARSPAKAPAAPKPVASPQDPLRSLLRGTHSAKVCAR